MKRGADDPQQNFFSFAAKVTPRGDGSYIVEPGKPQIGRVKLTAAEAAMRAGISADTILRLYDAGLIEGEQPSPRKTFIYEDSLLQHIKATRDREFWDRNRQLYLEKI